MGSACEAMQAAVTYGQDELRNKAQSYVEGNTRVCKKLRTVCTATYGDSLVLSTDTWDIVLHIIMRSTCFKIIYLLKSKKCVLLVTHMFKKLL